MDGFSFEYHPGSIEFGRGCLDRLETTLETLSIARPLVVCGSTVGSTPAVIDTVTDAIGDRLVGVFDETSAEKSFRTAVEGCERVRAEDVDGLVSLGGGSSLDVAKAITILKATDRSAQEVESFIRANGALPIPAGDLLPIVSIPTTLAGADLSAVGSVTLPKAASGLTADGDHRVGGFGDARLMPDALFYAPPLFATTPDHVLNASAMNGFDKGIELLYSRNATPITDATAKHGLGLLRSALPSMTADRSALEEAIVGTILVQYGLSTPGTGKLSIIHAFGHGLARHYPVQQGAVHGIAAPAVLEYVFDQVDGRRTEIADGLDLAVDEMVAAEAIVEAVAELRDDLGLPDSLREVDGLDPDAFPDLAAFILEDGIMRNRPPGLEPTQSDIEGVLESLW